MSQSPPAPNFAGTGEPEEAEAHLLRVEWSPSSFILVDEDGTMRPTAPTEPEPARNHPQRCHLNDVQVQDPPQNEGTLSRDGSPSSSQDLGPSDVLEATAKIARKSISTPEPQAESSQEVKSDPTNTVGSEHTDASDSNTALATFGENTQASFSRMSSLSSERPSITATTVTRPELEVRAEVSAADAVAPETKLARSYHISSCSSSSSSSQSKEDADDAEEVESLRLSQIHEPFGISSFTPSRDGSCKKSQNADGSNAEETASRVSFSTSEVPTLPSFVPLRLSPTTSAEFDPSVSSRIQPETTRTERPDRSNVSAAATCTPVAVAGVPSILQSELTSLSPLIRAQEMASRVIADPLTSAAEVMAQLYAACHQPYSQISCGSGELTLDGVRESPQEARQAGSPVAPAPAGAPQTSPIEDLVATLSRDSSQRSSFVFVRGFDTSMISVDSSSTVIGHRDSNHNMETKTEVRQAKSTYEQSFPESSLELTSQASDAQNGASSEELKLVVRDSKPESVHRSRTRLRDRQLRRFQLQTKQLMQLQLRINREADASSSCLDLTALAGEPHSIQPEAATSRTHLHPPVDSRYNFGSVDLNASPRNIDQDGLPVISPKAQGIGRYSRRGRRIRLLRRYMNAYQQGSFRAHLVRPAVERDFQASDPVSSALQPVAPTAQHSNESPRAELNDHQPPRQLQISPHYLSQSLQKDYLSDHALSSDENSFIFVSRNLQVYDRPGRSPDASGIAGAGRMTPRSLSSIPNIIRGYPLYLPTEDEGTNPAEIAGAPDLAKIHDTERKSVQDASLASIAGSSGPGSVSDRRGLYRDEALPVVMRSRSDLDPTLLAAEDPVELDGDVPARGSRPGVGYTFNDSEYGFETETEEVDEFLSDTSFETHDGSFVFVPTNPELLVSRLDVRLQASRSTSATAPVTISGDQSQEDQERQMLSTTSRAPMVPIHSLDEEKMIDHNIQGFVNSAFLHTDTDLQTAFLYVQGCEGRGKLVKYSDTTKSCGFVALTAPLSSQTQDAGAEGELPQLSDIEDVENYETKRKQRRRSKREQSWLLWVGSSLRNALNSSFGNGLVIGLALGFIGGTMLKLNSGSEGLSASISVGTAARELSEASSGLESSKAVLRQGLQVIMAMPLEGDKGLSSVASSAVSAASKPEVVSEGVRSAINTLSANISAMQQDPQFALNGSDQQSWLLGHFKEFSSNAIQGAQTVLSAAASAVNYAISKVSELASSVDHEYTEEDSHRARVMRLLMQSGCSRNDVALRVPKVFVGSRAMAQSTMQLVARLRAGQYLQLRSPQLFSGHRFYLYARPSTDAGLGAGSASIPSTAGRI